MKHYPSISKEIRHDIYIYAFNKIDGSNIRAEWNSKRGFYKFGTKNQLIDDKSEPFGICIQMIKNDFEDDLAKIFLKNNWKDAICFFELAGENSFAGQHNFKEKLQLTLIDVNPYKKGILPPKEFIEHFGHLNVAKVLYEGFITADLFDKIKKSTLPGMSYEGVVCKGASDNRSQHPIMFKIKTQAWLNKLKEYCKDNINLFNQLS